MELLLTLVVLTVLVTIAVPAMSDIGTQAADAAAKANVRSALPAAESFASDNVGTTSDIDKKPATSGYKGMTVALLRKHYDAGLSPTVKIVSSKTTPTAYCIAATVDGHSWSLRGPNTTTFLNNAKCK